MPAKGLKQETKLSTRNTVTQIDAVLELRVEGRELPNLDVLGGAFERALEVIQEMITESYKVVPPRDGSTPIAEPYAVKPS